MATLKGTVVLASQANAMIPGTNANDLVFAVGDPNQSIVFGRSNVTPCHMKINSNGFIGIGKSNPTDVLDVNGSISGNTLMTIRGPGIPDRVEIGCVPTESYINVGHNRTTNGYAYIDLVGDSTYIDYGLRLIRNDGGPNAGSSLRHRGTGGLFISADDASDINFSTNGTQRVKITANGNVGIGTSTPSLPLEVESSTNAYISVKSTNNATNANMQFQTTSGSHTIYRDSTGNFIIYDGTTNVVNVAANKSVNFAASLRIGYGHALVPASGSTYNGFIGSIYGNWSGVNRDGILIKSGGEDAGNANRHMIVDSSGQVYSRGGFITSVNLGDFAEYFEWADGNINGEDRIGYTVSCTLDGKIKKAEDGDYVIGAVSGNPTIVSNTAWDMWNNTYQRDEFGRTIMDNIDKVAWMDESSQSNYNYTLNELPHGIQPPSNARYFTDAVPRKNPEFDETTQYIPRTSRPEWSPVGLMGRVIIRKGQITNTTWKKIMDYSQSTELWLVK